MVPRLSDRGEGKHNPIGSVSLVVLTPIKGETGDIEDLCILCDPIPVSDGFDAPPVTSYPMKVERKKQREELNIVSVVEWRSGSDRWFLLTRRPEGGLFVVRQLIKELFDIHFIGLLAGLHEFPTSPEVPASISALEERETAMALLSCLIIKSPPVVDPQPKAADAVQSGVPRLVKIERAGDVLHVFSHIRKTYRVQWVVLEGGGADPPELAKRSSLAASSTTKKTRTKTKPKVAAGLPKLESMWIPLDDVEKAK
jgi:A/G-specific adenine glycosylase